MEIADLADYPELVSTLAAWFYAEWGHQRPDNSVQKVAARLYTHLNRDQVPLTLVALSGGSVCGSASLRSQDLAEREGLSPWLASVFVPAGQRGKGIGSALVSAAEQRAMGLGFERLYLYTADRESFYGRQGWSVLEQLEHAGKQIVVMVKTLCAV